MDDMHHEVRAPKPGIRWLLLIVILALVGLLGYAIGAMQSTYTQETAIGEKTDKDDAGSTKTSKESDSPSKTEQTEASVSNSSESTVSLNLPDRWSVKSQTSSGARLRTYPALDFVGAPTLTDDELPHEIELVYLEKQSNQTVEEFLSETGESLRESLPSDAVASIEARDSCLLLQESGSKQLYSCGRHSSVFVVFEVHGTHVVMLAQGQDPAISEQEMFDLIAFE